jgi:hypothetical protein
VQPQKETEPQPPSGDSSSDTGVLIVPPDASEIPLRPPIKATPTPRPKAPQAAPRAVIRVGGADVSTGSESQALASLRAAHSSRLEQPVVLRLGAREWWTTREELGARLPLLDLLRGARSRARIGQVTDLPLRYGLDEPTALKYLQGLAPKVRREPQEVGAGAGRDGEELSIGGSLARVRAALEAGDTTVELLSRPIAFVPKPREETPVTELPMQGVGVQSGDARFPVLLAEYSTKFNARLRDRTVNLKVAAQQIDRTVVPHNGVFSANQSIGPRTTTRGFRAAHIFMGKRVVDGVGGGICQSATTVYNAARAAKLPIVERHSHSLPVPYATRANDATIYWGQKDMRFRNTTGGPILVRTFLKGNRFHAQIFGAAR